MPLSYNVNLNALLGASVLGIVCAATMFVVEHYRNEKRRHGMAQDLARLDSELSVVRRELDKLLAQQRQKRESKTKRSRRSKAESIVSNGSATDGDSYVSAVDDSRDSSDLEFYDVSDVEEGDGEEQDPLKIIDTARNVTSAVCGCIAGISGHCKHISAVIFYINDEDSSTRTSVACGWKEPSVPKFAKAKYCKGQRCTDIFGVRQPSKVHMPFQLSKDMVTFQMPSMLQYMLQDPDMSTTNEKPQLPTVRIISNVLLTLPLNNDDLIKKVCLNQSSSLLLQDLYNADIEKILPCCALKDIDQLLDGDAESDFDTALAKLQLLSVDYPENQQLMWRVGRAYYKLAMLKQAEDDKLAMRELIDKGVEACSAALDGPTPPTAEIHKWMAILVGSRSDLQSTKDRISDANVFKKHVDAALEITPDDPVLHHMLGRFLFEMANLKWYERKVAGALFGDLPPATVQDALDHFLKCARLQNEPWKNNSFFIGKCKINLGDIEEGVKHLEAAARAQCDNGSDDEIDKELKTLLEKYASKGSSGLETNHSS